MDKRISVLKENQQILGNKISMLQETNKRKDEEADKIRQLIAECRQNLDRIKCETINPSQSDCIQKRNKCASPELAPCDPSQVSDTPPCDPCAKYADAVQPQPCNRSKSISASKGSEPCRGGARQQPCSSVRSQVSSCKDPCGDNKNLHKDPCQSPTSNIRAHISVLADAQQKSRQCIEKLGEGMERQLKMRIVQENSQLDDGCMCDTEDYQERVSCRVDLTKMKVNIRGPPEDLKKLDAVQLINLLDRFQCQELVINTGNNQSDFDLQGEVPVFYITHPGNLALIVGILMVAFLVNANVCSPTFGCTTKLLLNMLYLGSFAFHYGIVLWMTFIRGLTLSMGLTPELFNTVDNLILPKYFSICMFLKATTLYSFLATHCKTPCSSWPLPVMVQVIIESTAFLIELITICYIVPAIVKLRELTDEYSSEDDQCPPPHSYSRNMRKLGKLNSTITIINLLTVIFMGSNLYYISSKLNIGL